MSTQLGCDCATRPKNTGRPTCIETFGVPNGIVIGRWRADDGTINGIPAGTVINQAFVTAKLNHADQSKRWYVLPRAEMPTSERTADLTEEIDGVPKRTGVAGLRTRTFMLVGKNATAEMQGILETHQNEELGFLDLTRLGQIGGTNTGDGDLLFTKIEDDTFSLLSVEAQREAKNKLNVSFIIDETEKDSDRDFIPASDVLYATRLWYGIQPIEAAISEIDSSSQTEVVVQVDFARQNVSQCGLSGFDDVSFWTIYNNTDLASVTVLTATEDPLIDGRITLTFASQDDQDQLAINIDKDGYDAEELLVYIGATS